MSELIKPYELSIWEDILTNGTAKDLTSDTEIKPGKNYYIFNEETEEFELVTNPIVDEIKSYYEDKDISYYKERKLATIGSETMDGFNKAHDIVLHKNKNGEKTLSFKLKYKYYDPVQEKEVKNPFCSLIINESKVKLLYDDVWHDFIIKEVDESNEEYEWSYTAQDAFVMELSKNGYGVVLNADLNNNQGTALDLALKTLEDTNWEAINIDVAPPSVNEPLYTGIVQTSFTAKEMESNEDVTIKSGQDILVFYSYIINKDGNNVQFILRTKDDVYVIDDNYNIDALNYRIDETLEIIEDEDKITRIKKTDGTILIEIGDFFTKNQAYRTVYKQLTTYDPVMERTVDQYKAEDTIINHYTDSDYTTSDVVTSYITNGENFNIYEEGSTIGWYRHTSNTPPEMSLVTMPRLDPLDEEHESYLEPLDKIKQLEGFLETKFSRVSGTEEGSNLIFNSGFNDNSGMIENISKGEEFVLRTRIGMTQDNQKAEQRSDIINTTTDSHIDAVVAYYHTSGKNDLDDNDTGLKIMNPSGVIMRFNGIRKILNDEISGGYLTENDTQYIINGVVEEPSTKYVYKVVTNESEGAVEDYVWDSDNSKYVKKSTKSNFLDYYYTIAQAERSIPSEVFENPQTKIGIFFYATSLDSPKYYYFQDIQLTRLYRDANKVPVTLGNIPTTTVHDKDYYYIAPEINTNKNKVELYSSLEDIAPVIGVNYEDIQPIYNIGNINFMSNEVPQPLLFRVKKTTASKITEQFRVRGYSLEKILSVDGAQSNCFNILQSIAEAFECWIELDVQHDEDGAIILDEFGMPLKQVLLKRYAGEDNFAGFKYGVNLNSIQRTVDSNEIVTKLIVDNVQNEYVDSGIVSIENAPSNITGESYIYNFEYYLNKELIKDRKTCETDVRTFEKEIGELNKQLKTNEKSREYLEAALTKINSNRNVYTNFIEEATENYNDALDFFKDATNQTYDEYQQSGEPINKLLEIDTMADRLGMIYTCAAVLNNYSGLLTNANLEYEATKLLLDGRHEHTIIVSRIQDPNSQAWHVRIELDDYDLPFNFTLADEEYKSDVNTKSFDIETNETAITAITTGDEFKLRDADDNIVTSITVTETKIQKFRLVPIQETDGINQVIKDLIEQKKALIKKFTNKYSRFILEGTWTSDQYISDELYYFDAKQASRLSAFPKITYNIQVAELSGLEDYKGYRFDTGDKTYIEDIEFFGWQDVKGVRTPVKEQVIVSEIEYHLDNPADNNITIQNYKSNFEDLFQRIEATVQTVQYNEQTYIKTNSVLNPDGTLKEPQLIQSLNNIKGIPHVLTADGSISIDGDNILIKDLANTANQVRINSSGIGISSDGGQNFSTVVNGQGVNLNNVFASSIDTNKIVIGDKNNPSFRWDSSGINAFKYDESDPDTPYDLGTFVRLDRFGLYGIEGDEVFQPTTLEQIENKASFGVTWNGFFLKSDHGNGYVSISKKNDFEVIQTINGEKRTRIKIGALEFNEQGIPTVYGMNMYDRDGKEVITTDSDGNITLTGTIQSKNYRAGLEGWCINQNGNAEFNNITARGSIKTAVFEYSEIQAVGGISLFRPSSTIRSARIADNKQDLIIEVERSFLFNVDDWVKVSNYNTENKIPEQDISNVGLVYIYKISERSSDGKTITLEGAAQMLGDSLSVEDLVGGALISMGKYENGQTTNNYGIGINSSDNSILLPKRAISLFETNIDSSASSTEPKLDYNFRGILGTLPDDLDMDNTIKNYMKGTQGIYTDNMYIGDDKQYVSFYTDDSEDRQLRIKLNNAYLSNNLIRLGEEEGPRLQLAQDKLSYHSDSKNELYSIYYQTLTPEKEKRLDIEVTEVKYEQTKIEDGYTYFTVSYTFISQDTLEEQSYDIINTYIKTNETDKEKYIIPAIIRFRLSRIYDDINQKWTLGINGDFYPNNTTLIEMRPIKWCIKSDNYTYAYIASPTLLLGGTPTTYVQDPSSSSINPYYDTHDQIIIFLNEELPEYQTLVTTFGTRSSDGGVGKNSFTIGQQLINPYNNSLIIGQYNNVRSMPENVSFAIGNGYIEDGSEHENTSMYITSDGFIKCNGIIPIKQEMKLNAKYFKLSTNANSLLFQRCGNVCSLTGSISPKENISGSTTKYEITTIEVGNRPTRMTESIMASTGVGIWNLEINSDTGQVTFSRFRNGNTLTQITPSTVLRINIMWIVSQI